MRIEKRPAGPTEFCRPCGPCFAVTRIPGVNTPGYGSVGPAGLKPGVSKRAESYMLDFMSMVVGEIELENGRASILNERFDHGMHFWLEQQFEVTFVLFLQPTQRFLYASVDLFLLCGRNVGLE